MLSAVTVFLFQCNRHRQRTIIINFITSVLLFLGVCFCCCFCCCFFRLFISFFSHYCRFTFHWCFFVLSLSVRLKTEKKLQASSTMNMEKKRNRMRCDAYVWEHEYNEQTGAIPSHMNAFSFVALCRCISYNLMDVPCIFIQPFIMWNCNLDIIFVLYSLCNRPRIALFQLA